MTVFEQILWFLIQIRLLGRPPKLPIPRESLIHYAAVLEIQYSRICVQLGTARRREVVAIAGGIIALLGLTQAAEPLPPKLLSLLDRNQRARPARPVP